MNKETSSLMTMNHGGGLAEWPMAAVLNTASCNSDGGSNPSPSSKPNRRSNMDNTTTLRQLMYTLDEFTKQNPEALDQPVFIDLGGYVENIENVIWDGYYDQTEQGFIFPDVMESILDVEPDFLTENGDMIFKAVLLE